MPPPAYHEEVLLQNVANGDEKSFAALFHHYRNKIFTVAYKLTASEENAEEIVQDVFMKVWNKRQSLTEVENFDAWLFIITRNTVYSFLRSKAAKELYGPIPDTEIIGVIDDADMRVREKEFQAILQEAMDQLPQQQKQVYLLSKESGLSYQQIGQQLSIAPETARKHLQYAMKTIRACLLSRMDLGMLILILWKIS